MKLLKALTLITGIMFAAGLLLILGAAGNSDLGHDLNVVHMIIGILIMVPFPLMAIVMCNEGKTI